jgi:hypothetical protein
MVKSSYQRCYHGHPPYEVAPGLFIYGGSCIDPAVDDADVYVGFDMGMRNDRGDNAYPWTKSTAFLFKIDDMCVPASVPHFLKLIEYLEEQLKAGKKVHLGCIGGHGRTGLVLAALHTHLTGDKASIQHVRKHYCERVVESDAQVNFLHKHFGIEKVAGSKASHGGGKYGGMTADSWGTPHSSVEHFKKKGGSASAASQGKTSQTTGMPFHMTTSVWGPLASQIFAS